MQGYRIDIIKTVIDNITQLLLPNEKILHTYEVVPLDYNVIDFNSPKFYITQTRLIFTYDEAIEIYNLSELEIALVGEQPKFDMRNVIFEKMPMYFAGNYKEIEKLKSQDGLAKVSINESKQVPKYFLLREGSVIQKGYKTWALQRLMNNIKVQNYNNEELVKMLTSYFQNYNQKTLLTFIFVFLGYVILKLVFGFLLPRIASTILDVIFFIIIGFVGYWLYVTVDKNFKKFEQIYLSYSHVN